VASDCIVPVVRVSNVKEHPNAALLCVVEVLGYQMVSALVEDPEGPLTRLFVKDKRDERGRRVPADDAHTLHGAETEAIRFKFPYAEGDRGVYFPADTLIPEEWAEKFGVRHYLHGPNKDRVKHAKLRGEPSFGVLVRLPEDVDWEVGKNVAEYYGAQKYLPPVKFRGGDIAPYDNDIDPHFVKYTNIQNGKLLFEKFLAGEEVVATEKVHGCNSRVSVIGSLELAGSHTTRKKRPDEGDEKRHQGGASTYWYPWSIPGVADMLHHLQETHNVVILFGEIYGLQSLKYGIDRRKGLGYRAFDLYVDGKYLDWPEVEKICAEFGVPTVPVLYRGLFDLAKIQEVSKGNSVIDGANHIREGVVVKPVKERRDPALGRVILKFLSDDYLLSKHKKKDTTDV